MTAPLIGRTKLFGNPGKSFGQVSPDGQWLAWIASRDGVTSIWVTPVANRSKERQLTHDKHPVGTFDWAPDSATILYIGAGAAGDNAILYGVDVRTGVQRSLTPIENTRVQIVALSPSVRDRILVGLNNRDPRWQDIHSLHLDSGRLTPVLLNTGDYGRFWADGNLNLRLAYRSRPDGGRDYFQVHNNKVEAEPAYEVGFDDVAASNPLNYSADGKTLYWQDSRGRDTAALFAIDVASGKTTLLAERADCDLGPAVTHPLTGRLEAYQAYYMKPEWVALDAELAPDIGFLNEQMPDGWAIGSRSHSDDLWTVTSTPGTAPPVMFLYERSTRRLTKLYSTRPELEGAPLASMHAISIQSRDALVQVSYLTLPPGSDANDDGRPDTPVPMVLYVHDGPWARDTYGFNIIHQWLANRGYAVLSPNFRASTGFGKAHLAGGNLQWGAKMQDDLLDAVEWAIACGITTTDKVAIMGSFYGGYAALAGLTFTPEVFACAVAIAAPSNLATLIDSTPAYLQSERVQLHTRIGDPTTKQGQRLLQESSPVFKADSIKKPLLIGQGTNDPRLRQEDADRIVSAMEEKNIPVTFVSFPDEGCDLARPQNSIAFHAIAEGFLKACLGGRSEPLNDALEGSSARVLCGAEGVPGLAAALRTR